MSIEHLAQSLAHSMRSVSISCYSVVKGSVALAEGQTRNRSKGRERSLRWTFKMSMGWTERRRTSSRWSGKGRAPRLAWARERKAVWKDEERRQRPAGRPSAMLRGWAWPQ